MKQLESVSRVRARRASRLGALLLAAVALFSQGQAFAAQVNLKVLLVVMGPTDPRRSLMEDYMGQLGVPYDVFDCTGPDLNMLDLIDNGVGRYNGVILTQSQGIAPDGSDCFTGAEFSLLHDYEANYGVREVVLSGFPGTDFARNGDYGMATIDWQVDAEGQWVGQAGGSEYFEYVNTQSLFPSSGFGYRFTPRNGSGDPFVEPLLLSTQYPGDHLISKITYPNGREVLFSGIDNAWFYLHSQVLAYEFLNFATRGVFIGARRVYLEVHNDDMFLPDELWDPATDQNFPEDQKNFRLSGPEVDKLVAAQRAFHTAHPLATALITDVAFNAVGANASSDPLTQALQRNKNELGWINHTYEAKQMDRICTETTTTTTIWQRVVTGVRRLFGFVFNIFGWEPVTTTETTVTCVRTDYQTAYDEINRNAQAWQSLGFPDADKSRYAVLTDSHSGLHDRMGTVDDPSDDILFSAGFNPALGQAAEALGVRMLASDHSRTNQDIIQRVPGFNLVLMPRYPTSMFYNTSNPTELVDEYNYIFHYRYLAANQDPCTIPGALCTPRNYQEILASEADTTVRHMMAGEPFPHYFHQPNLHTYDSAGHILQLDWMDAVMSRYESMVNLPIESPRFDELADLAWKTVLWRESGVRGVFDTATGKVTLTALKPAEVDVTGIAGGSIYGGQSQRSVQVSTTPVTFDVDLQVIPPAPM